ncbi:unnamed protein product [Ambrosiozyma monospora]|uniref:Unnamed protein product n=1 Tax=Ambrosiozyma monospora TaxID=43982 RepID=A0ACB5UBM5_AMBMO|nr:unnamed protein product [Ambrosiozyma monospora]
MPVQPELPLPQTGNGNIHSNGNGSADIVNSNEALLDLLDSYNMNSAVDLGAAANRNGHNVTNSAGTNNPPIDIAELERANERKAKMAILERYQRNAGLRAAAEPSLYNSVYGSVYDYETAEKLLSLVQGNLVQFPTRWLKNEVEGSNWFYKADKLPPIQIYN